MKLIKTEIGEKVHTIEFTHSELKNIFGSMGKDNGDYKLYQQVKEIIQGVN